MYVCVTVVRRKNEDGVDQWYETWIAPGDDATKDEHRNFMNIVEGPESASLPRTKQKTQQRETDGDMKLKEVYTELEDQLTKTALEAVMQSRYAKSDGDAETRHADAETLTSYGNAFLSRLRNFFFPETNKELLEQLERKDLEQAEAIFVPTGAIRFLQALERALPNHTLMVNDFDMLPLPKKLSSSPEKHFEVQTHTDALNNPIVSGTDASARKSSPPPHTKIRHFTTHTLALDAIVFGADGTLDYGNYLSPRPFGTADIFFAVDFPSIKWFLRNKQGRKITVRTLIDVFRIRFSTLRTQKIMIPSRQARQDHSWRSLVRNGFE